MKVNNYFLLISILLMSFTSTSSAASQKANSTSFETKKSVIGIKYFNKIMGNVHQNASRFSQVLTTISCNHPVKMVKEVSKDGKDLSSYIDPNWTMVNVGPYDGFIMTDYLTDKKNECFEEEYPKYFDGLNLDINDLYYWARLYDQYVQGKSKVKQ